MLEMERQKIPREYDQLYRRNFREGFYFDQLKPYFESFPRDRILVLYYEDWEKPDNYLINKICYFIGVELPFTWDLSKKYNVSVWPRSQKLNRFLNQRLKGTRIRKLLPIRLGRAILNRLNLKPAPPLLYKDHAALTQLYREDILALQKLLNTDLSHWLNGKKSFDKNK